MKEATHPTRARLVALDHPTRPSKKGVPSSRITREFRVAFWTLCPWAHTQTVDSSQAWFYWASWHCLCSKDFHRKGVDTLLLVWL